MDGGVPRMMAFEIDRTDHLRSENASSRSAQSLRRAYIAITILVLGAATLAATLLSDPIRRDAAFAGLVVGIVGGLPAIFTKRGVIGPPGLIGLLTYFGATVKLTWIATFGDSRPDAEARLLNGGSDLSILTSGAIWFAVALGVLHLGYALLPGYVRFGLPAIANRPQLETRRLLRVGALVSIAGLLGFVLFALDTGFSLTNPSSWTGKRFNDLTGGAQERTSSLRWVFFRLALLPRLALYLLILGLATSHKWTERERLTHRRLIVLSAALSVAVPFYASNRAGIAILLLDVTLLLTALGYRVKLSRGLAAAIAAVGVMVFTLLGRSNADRSLLDGIEQTLTGRDLMDISKFSLIVDAVPGRVDQLGGETLIGWIFAPIPQSVLPVDLLWARLGPYVYQEVYGLSGTSGIPASFFGELWLNFGPAGLITGTFVFGMLLRLVTNSLIDRMKTPFGALMYSLVVVRLTVFTLGNDFGTGILKTALEIVPLLIALRFVTEKSER